MAAPAQVTWAELAENGAEIAAIGGIRRTLFGKAQWRLSVDDAIELMEMDEWRFFIETDEEKNWLDICENGDGSKTISADGPIKALL